MDGKQHRGLMIKIDGKSRTVRFEAFETIIFAKLTANEPRWEVLTSYLISSVQRMTIQMRLCDRCIVVQLEQHIYLRVKIPYENVA